MVYQQERQKEREKEGERDSETEETDRHREISKKR